MRRPIPVLLVILAAQLGLAALLAERKNPLAATTPQTPLIDASLDHVDHIVVEGQPAKGASADSARVELAKQKDGQWILTNYFDAPADKFRLSSVLDELVSLKRGLPIATSQEAIRRFKLADDNFERRVTLRSGDKALGTLYFGSSAGVRQTDARTNADHAVYDVQLATYELPTSPSDWLDQDILQRDPDSLSELEIDGGGSALKLVRQAAPASPTKPATTAAGATPGKPSAAGGAAASAPGSRSSTADTSASAKSSPPKIWVDTSLPKTQTIDTAHADTLARDVAELHIEGILGTSVLPAWQPEHPALTLHIRDSKHPDEMATWTLYRGPTPPAPATAPAPKPHAPGAAPASAPSQPGPDYYVLKDSAHPWYFKVSAVTGKQLLDDSSLKQLVASVGAGGQDKGAAKDRPEVGSAGHGHHTAPGRKPGSTHSAGAGG
jgi:hypothetical protein